VIVNAADYIPNTQEVQDAVLAFRRSRPNDPVWFITAGRISDQAKNTFDSSRIAVIEEGRADLLGAVASRPNAAPTSP
jgi:hypothetical protein